MKLTSSGKNGAMTPTAMFAEKSLRARLSRMRRLRRDAVQMEAGAV